MGLLKKIKKAHTSPKGAFKAGKEIKELGEKPFKGVRKQFNKFLDTEVGQVVATVAIAVASFYTGGLAGGAWAGAATGAATGAVGGAIQADVQGTKLSAGALRGAAIGASAGYAGGAAAAQSATAGAGAVGAETGAVGMTPTPTPTPAPVAGAGGAAPASQAGGGLLSTAPAAQPAATTGFEALAEVPWTAADVSGGVITQAGSGGLTGAMSTAGSFVTENPMMAYLLLNTASSAFNPTAAEEQTKVEEKREGRELSRRAKATDVSGLKIKKRRYQGSQYRSPGLLNRGQK